MVDLLSMFRRRPAKRKPPGFARPREDITALGDSIGDLLTSPVRDAPPLAREAIPIAREVPLPRPSAPPPAEETPRPPRTRENSRTNGATAPRQTKRAGYLAVHSVEKSFG